MSLEGDVGEMKGMLDQLIPQIKRALNNQEEAFKRLKDGEVQIGKNEVEIKNIKEVEIENLKEDMKGLKKISGFISAGLTLGINAFFRFILWKDQ